MNDSLSFNVNLKNFNGPLEVLLDLAKSQKVNLENISITKLADKFHEFITKAKDIIINTEGIKHPMYKNKPKIFDSFCWHYDELENLPLESKVLSFNDKSSVQSLVFSRGKSDIWAVQYHPEFNPKWIAGLMKQRESLLLNECIYSNTKEFNKVYNFLSNLNEFKDKKNELSISKTILDSKIHTLELANWCEYLMNDIQLTI